MKKTQATINENLQSQDAETSITKKTWEAPKLRILPVPVKTQGGAKKNDQDDVFYFS